MTLQSSKWCPAKPRPLEEEPLTLPCVLLPVEVDGEVVRVKVDDGRVL